MSSCVGFGEDLAEVALGRRPSDALSRHIWECHACASELTRLRALAQRLDAAVSATVQADPPPMLLAQIRERVRNAPAPALWRVAWPRAAVGLAVAASVIGLAFGLRAMRPPSAMTGPDVSALAQWHSPTAALLSSRGSVLEAPLPDAWFDVEMSPSRTKPTPGGTHAT